MKNSIVDDRYNLLWLFAGLLVVFVLGVLLFPLAGFFLFFFVAFLIANSSKFKLKRMVFFVLYFMLVMCIIINENSIQRFIYREDDFTTYYNNYLELLNGNYEFLFQFGGGVEIGLPALNYIFSFFIGNPFPYFLQMTYIGMYIVMLYYLVSIDRYFGNRDKSNKLDLLLWATLFLKITAMLTIERQAVASFFILYAISDIRRKYLWLFIGCLFHLSTPVVYLAVRFVLNTKTNKKVLVSCIALILFVVFSHQLLSVINHILPNDKVGYVLYYINNGDFIKNELVKSIKQVSYVIPLLLLDFAMRLQGYRWKLSSSLQLFVYSMLILSFLPGVPTRIFMPIVFILYGFYYYDFICLFRIKTRVIIFLIITSFFSVYKFFLPGYYYRYPIANIYPGYYISSFFDKYGYVERYSLPYSSDININNDDKL